MNRHRDGTQKGTIARVSIAAVTGVPNDSPQAFAVNCHRANRPRSANDLSTPQMLGAGLACRRVAPLVLPHRRGSSATVAPSALPGKQTGDLDTDHERVHAKGTVSSRCTQLATWRENSSMVVW